MDFPPRAASRWDETETVPRAEFDAYVRGTERVLSQLQAAVDGHTVGPNLQDRLVAQERRLHALERGWQETQKRLGAVEETSGRPPDLKLVEARCSWLEDEFREQNEQLSGLVDQPAAQEASLRGVQEQLLSVMHGEIDGLRRQLTAEAVQPERFARWEECIKEELADSVSLVESLRMTVSEQAVARDAQLTAIEQAVRRLQRATVPAPTAPTESDAEVLRRAEAAAAAAKAERDAAAAKAEAEQKARKEAEEAAKRAQELLEVERKEREELAAQMQRMQQSPAAVAPPPVELGSPGLDETTEKRLERIWKEELAATETRLSADMDALRSRNLQLEKLLADAAKEKAKEYAKKEAIEKATKTEPHEFPAAASHAPKPRKVSCVVHVDGLDTEELEDEIKLARMFEKFGAVIATTLRRRRVVENGKTKVSWALISFATESQAKAAVAGSESLGYPQMVTRLMNIDQAMAAKGNMAEVAKKHNEKELAAVREDFLAARCLPFRSRFGLISGEILQMPPTPNAKAGARWANLRNANSLAGSRSGSTDQV